MLNRTVLMGRICNDIELKHTANDIPVTTFRLAVDRNYIPKGQEKQTDYINIVTWRNTAEFVSRYFRKGQLVALEGSIQTRQFTDKNGNNRTAFEVVADQVYFAEGKSDKTKQESTPPPAFEPQQTSFSVGDFEEIDENGELPF